MPLKTSIMSITTNSDSVNINTATTTNTVTEKSTMPSTTKKAHDKHKTYKYKKNTTKHFKKAHCYNQWL
jgi:hypothetical protein